jgi:hypothetical protein
MYHSTEIRGQTVPRYFSTDVSTMCVCTFLANHRRNLPNCPSFFRLLSHFRQKPNMSLLCFNHGASPRRGGKWKHSSLVYDVIFNITLDRIKRDNIKKELFKNIMSIKSYSTICVEITEFACRHYIAPRLFSCSPRDAASAPTIQGIINLIFMKKSTATDKYWSSYVSAKFDAAMESFEAKTRRAISRLILDLCRNIIHINVSNNIIYHFISRDSKKEQSELQ